MGEERGYSAAPNYRIDVSENLKFAKFTKTIMKVFSSFDKTVKR
jgi:hypothetical protein